MELSDDERVALGPILAHRVPVWVVRCPEAGEPMIFTDSYSAHDERDELLAQGYQDVTVDADTTMTQDEIWALPEHPGWD